MMEARTDPSCWSRAARRDLVTISLVAVATHGVLLLMDGVYFDGHLLYSHLTTKNWPVLNLWFGHAGLMFIESFHRALGTLPDIVFGYRLIAFLSITLTAVFWYLICCESRMLAHSESLAIALVQLTFPAFRTMFGLIMLPYLVCYLLFVIGVYVAVRSYCVPGLRKYALRLVSLVLLFFSFSTNSFLVFYSGFIVFMVFFVRRTKMVSILAAAKSYVFRHIDFLLLPFVYWGIKEAVMPRHGVYENYNRVQMSLKALVLGYVKFIPNAVLLQLNEALLQLLALPALWLVLAAMMVFWYIKHGSTRSVTFESPTSPRSLIAVGVALVLLAMLPYALVSKPATVVGWQTRFSLLVSIGVGVIIVGVCKALCTGPGGQLSRGGLAVLGTLVLAFATTMVDSYISWEMRWVKDNSVTMHLRSMPPCSASTYWIDDQFPLPSEVSLEPYWDYDWSTIFKDAWGGETRTGIYPGTNLASYDSTKGESYRTREWGRICNLSGYDASGPQARLTIRSGPSGNGIKMVLWYWWYRYVNRSRFEAYVRNVTEVTLAVLPEPHATPRPGSPSN